MEPMLVIKEEYERLTTENQRMRSGLLAIEAAVDAELERIEQHGGCAGFPKRVQRMTSKALGR